MNYPKPRKLAPSRAIMLSLTGLFVHATSLIAVLPVQAQDATSVNSGMTESKTQDVVAAAEALLGEFAGDTLTQIQFPFPTRPPSEASFARTASAQYSSAPPADAASQPADSPENPAPAGAPPAGAQGGRPGGGQNMAFIGEQYGDAVWSNYPVSDVPRSGVQLGQMSDAQRVAAMTLLQTVLSADGYQKVLDVMGSDQALAGEGQNFASGEDVYTMAILGTPSATDPWMIAFTGHTLASMW